MKPKIFIGPMSKNIVDAIIEFCNKANYSIGLIPSRRQVENVGGYVNDWNTEEFSQYVKSKTKNILLVRDHAGPGQGQNDDNGYESLKEDCKHFDVIHIDPWKKYPNFSVGLEETINMINYCFNLNPTLKFEVGTEEAIRRFDPYELMDLMVELKKRLPFDAYNNIEYLVIQSGTLLEGNNQIGNYDSNRLKEMVNVCNQFNILSKEHNGDYLSNKLIKEKFDNGLYSINIAPEFGQIETKVILNRILELNREDLLDLFYNICYDSKKWVKWVPESFNPEKNKTELINICGHYVFSNNDFKSLKKELGTEVDQEIKSKLFDRIEELYTISKY